MFHVRPILSRKLLAVRPVDANGVIAAAEHARRHNVTMHVAAGAVVLHLPAELFGSSYETMTEAAAAAVRLTGLYRVPCAILRSIDENETLTVARLEPPYDTI